MYYEWNYFDPDQVHYFQLSLLFNLRLWNYKSFTSFFSWYEMGIYHAWNFFILKQIIPWCTTYHLMLALLPAKNRYFGPLGCLLAFATWWHCGIPAKAWLQIYFPVIPWRFPLKSMLLQGSPENSILLQGISIYSYREPHWIQSHMGCLLNCNLSQRIPLNFMLNYRWFHWCLHGIRFTIHYHLIHEITWIQFEVYVLPQGIPLNSSYYKELHWSQWATRGSIGFWILCNYV